MEPSAHRDLAQHLRPVRARCCTLPSINVNLHIEQIDLFYRGIYWLRRYEDDASDTAAGDSDDDEPERARRELGATRLPLTDPFGDPVPIGKGASLLLLVLTRTLRPHVFSGFDSLVVGTSSAPKITKVELDSPERASFLHRHHLKVNVILAVVAVAVMTLTSAALTSIAGAFVPGEAKLRAHQHDGC